MEQAQRIIDTMGTIVTLSIYHENPDPLLDHAENMLADFNERFTTNADSSDLMQVNLASGKHPVKVDEDLFWLIKRAKEVSIASDGAFNLTIGPVVKLWHIGFDDADVPTDEEIQEKLALTDPEAVELNEEELTVYLKKSGMEIDLGAIAKGYFADLIKTYFLENGVESGIVDLGGNVLTIGSSPTREDGKWRIGIQNPFKNRNEVLAVAAIEDISIVTSGIYERHFEKEGKNYHHIIDSQTGYPTENDLASVSIFSKESIDGEIWTTVMFVKNAEDAIAEISKLSHLGGIVISKAGKMYMTANLSEMVEIVKPDK